MPISRLLRSIAIMMLVVAVAGAGLALWTTQRAAIYNERITLAHMSYEAHLQLSNNTYQLFKQYGDAMLIGDLDEGLGETTLIRAIRDNIRDIRGIIGKEIEMVGDEEIEELELLSDMERKINDLIERFEAVRTGSESDDFSLNWVELSIILEDDIDRDFLSMIQAALEEEVEEVDETRAAADRNIALGQRLALLLMFIAIGLTAATLWVYRRQIDQPLDDLMKGVGRLAAGRFDTPVIARGNTEIAEVSRVMNTMAAMVDERTKSLTLENAELEAAVSLRTRELEAMLTKTQEAEEARRQMLADVSHELRTPLTIIQGESDVALRGEDKDPEEYREALRRTRDTAKHTNMLVNDLLFVAREEIGNAKLKKERTDLKVLVTDAVALFDRDIHVTTDLVEAPANVDRARIRQCIAAMIQNARSYGGPDIVVRLLETARGYRIAVEDNGPGLSDKEKAKAFQRFFRGSNAAESYREGAGLGLPVVRAIAEAHGGTAELRDRAGGGLSSILNIPVEVPLRVVSG